MLSEWGFLVNHIGNKLALMTGFSSMSSLNHTTPTAILSGWKDIANYLGKGVRTVQRYEHELGLPIRRPAGKSSSSVIATKPEIDAWVAACATRLGQSEQHSSALLNEFKSNVTELRRLREHTAESRQAYRESRHRLLKTLESIQAHSAQPWSEKAE